MKKYNSLSKLYLGRKLEESRKFLSIFYVIGTTLYLGFWIADYVQYYEHRYEFLIIRIGFCFLALCSFFVNKSNQTFLKNQVWQLALTFYGSLGITYMMMRTEGPTSVYFSGLNLVAVISLMFATYQASLFVVALVLTYLPYFILCLLHAQAIGNNGIFIHLFFIFGTIFTIIFARDRREKELISLLSAQAALSEVVENRDSVIAQKTAEAVNLNALSAQFSPQVVKAIRDGSIKLDESVHRSKICAIFIDIVNSTERVVRLDQAKVQLVLARFLDTTLTTFLKYDLTIDKFHGDGVLAFSNDPIQRADFVERVCMAALEVRESISVDQDFYILNWKNEMQVRIGIAVGFANVGFYGDKKYFRSFTAIGAPLPFASRLTSIAQPNQILVDFETAEILRSQKFILNLVGERKLKGFDQDKNIVYSLEAPPISNAALVGAKACPDHPYTVLHLDTNDKGLFIFKCRECGFEDTKVSGYDNIRTNAKKIIQSA